MRSDHKKTPDQPWWPTPKRGRPAHGKPTQRARGRGARPGKQAYDAPHADTAQWTPHEDDIVQEPYGPSALAQCAVRKRCSGCQLQNMSYPQQLRYKQALVGRLLGGFGKVSPIVGMHDPYHYRNKAQAMYGIDRNGRIISGVYQSTTGRIVATDHCLLQDEAADRIFVSIRRLLRDFKLKPYDDISGRGLLRHVLVRRGAVSGQIMVALVVATPIFPAKYNFARALTQLHPEITTVVLNINDRFDGLMLGQREQVLYGPGYIEDELCGLQFRIGARSFYQINHAQTELLYRRALELAALTGQEEVLDAYCGIGTISLAAARQARAVVGVESNRAAVSDAIANAKRNGISNCRFLCADAGDYMTERAQAHEPVDVVLLDPPRAGASQAFLQALVALAPKRVVYISCDPSTQARDLRYLTGHGYRVQALEPFDLFPHTHHVECIALLTREHMGKRS